MATITNYLFKAARFESTQATGVAPLVVASTTTVSNLSVTNLNGQPGSYYLTRSNHTGTMAWADVSKTGSSLADLTTRSAADLSSGTLLDARVAASNVTQHQASLSIATSQLTGTLADARVAASNVTQHQAALSIGWAQITGEPTTLDGYGITGGTVTGTITAGNLTLSAAGVLTFADGSTQSTAGVGSANALSTTGDAVVTGDSDSNGAGAVILRTGATDRLTVANGGAVTIGGTLGWGGGAAITSSDNVPLKGSANTFTATQTVANLTLSASGVLTFGDGTTMTTAVTGATYVGAKAYITTTAQTINNATTTTLNFTAESWDTDGFHDNATNNSRFTVPSGKDGKYEFSALVTFDANSTGSRSVGLYKNGTLVAMVTQQSVATLQTRVYASVPVSLVATDYMDVRVYQDSTVSSSAHAGEAVTWASLTYLGA